jgi:hypothetical protein
MHSYPRTPPSILNPVLLYSPGRSSQRRIIRSFFQLKCLVVSSRVPIRGTVAIFFVCRVLYRTYQITCHNRLQLFPHTRRVKSHPFRGCGDAIQYMQLRSKTTNLRENPATTGGIQEEVTITENDHQLATQGGIYHSGAVFGESWINLIGNFKLTNLPFRCI